MAPASQSACSATNTLSAVKLCTALLLPISTVEFVILQLSRFLGSQGKPAVFRKRQHWAGSVLYPETLFRT